MKSINTQVIIVGGGPVGLTMALSLKHLGVDFVILEKTDGLINHPRVGTVGVRSMEIFRKLGVSAQLYKSGWPESHPMDVTWTTGLGGHEIYRLKRGNYLNGIKHSFSPETEAVCPHHWLCPNLQSHLQAYPEGPLLLNTKVIDFKQNDKGVVVQAKHTKTNDVTEFQAQYIVACDGGRSQIRQGCNIEFEQHHPSTVFENILFEAPYLHDLLGDNNSMIHFMVTSSGLRYPLRSMDGKSLYRLTVKPQTDEVIDPIAMVKKAVKFDTQIYIKSSIRWELSHRVANKYRDRRVLLAGDAAHVISPSGGYGMNTGIADADNLAWKIAAVLNRDADDTLLDTYEQERRPVALMSLEESKSNLMRTLKRPVPTHIDDDSATGEQCRADFKALLIDQQAAREFNSPDIHLGSRYHSDVVCKGGDVDKSVDWQDQALVGCRAPHLYIERDKSILDLFGQGFVLLCLFEPEQKQLDTQQFQHLPIKFVYLNKQLVEERYKSLFTLIRPDGYIAWQGNQLDHTSTKTIELCCGKTVNKNLKGLQSAQI
ncbi:FAD-dependent monooxygenase [Pseudoalteromonas luteoviolacea]|uniref:FAD-dependent monooxygenase n=1 Tax=Pseudoalteromonas luteoviolacea TaxID=43657 RepID=UPI001EED0B6A|nr:FAD-dependent monooxygenase [Pseudoalteromonas luteoviolacea]MCF6439266.1 FAD-dependent monooxygenase [Pseudoalteromonas luteoviolacea]